MCLLDDLRDIVGVPHFIENRVALDGQIRGLPRVGVVQSRGDDVDPENQRGRDVQDGPGRNHKRRSDVGDLAPCRALFSNGQVENELSRISSQSNVNGKRPMPLFIPKIWLTTGFLGAIQQTQVK